MKRYVLALAIISIMSFSLVAQNRPSPEERMKAETEQMVKELNLSESQEDKVTKINEDFGQRQNETRENNRGNREAMRDKMMELNEERNKELKAVLSDDQYKKYLEMQEEKRKERRAGRQGGNRNF